MNNNGKICALVVTYNRKKYLIKLLNSLINQSVKLDKIIIFDNSSSDGTNELLKNEGFIKESINGKVTLSMYNDIEILYYLNEINSGGSGGFSKGIKLALEQNCEYIWTMDDDVLPEINCLEELISNMNDNMRICIPNRSDELFSDYAITKLNMSNPFKYNIKSRKTKIKADELKENVTNIVDMPFEGPLFHKSIIQKVGFPNENLFIIFDDSEYAYRASKYTNIGFVKNAILHKQIVPVGDKNRLMNWKNYYGYRNQYWFDRKYGKNIFVKKLRPFLNHIDLICRAVVRRKWSNIRILNAAFYDGTHEILGKKVEPGSEFIWNKINDK